MPTVDPSLEEEITAEIMTLINPLAVSFGLLLEAGMNVKGVNDVTVAARAAAQGWAKRLLNEADNVAPEAGRNLLEAVFQGERPPPDFWRSKLGQLLVSRDAFPYGEVSRYEASCVLGLTRAWGEYAWKNRLLTRHTDKQAGKEGLGFERQSLMQRWRHDNRDSIYGGMLAMASVDHIELPGNPVGKHPGRPRKRSPRGPSK